MLWDDIIGQDNAISLLKTLAKEENFNKPLLFLGKNGIGKRLTARIFGCAINCENLGCNTCHSCRMFNKGIHPDIKEIRDDNGYIKINIIRDIIKEAYLKPAYRRRVYIIDNCHFLTEEAENSLLKILEEAKETLFILITSSISLFPTILSRCFTIRFKPLSLNSQRRIFELMGEEFQKDIGELSFGSISLALEYSKYDVQGIISWLDLFKKEKSLNVANMLVEMETNKFPLLLDILISILRKKASFSFIEKLLSAKESINANCNRRLVLERIVLDD